ncbi:hypothetical protein GLW05_08140 [Pontibacillus yanchengensis]|uniref:Uncharacterized protein n=1 Tax=Pontibacillus yanchengensis TaxID=462910 RepID=A0A6I4ZTL6_9BACI|nr:hypothetical protein [Pontibacillus yanchengensis]
MLTLLIKSQPYKKMTRMIKDNQQQYFETEEWIELYDTVISTNTNQFKLEHVHDMSYKPLSDRYGFLYLHTNQGVFSYNVAVSPSDFIEAFKQLKE